MSEDNKETQKEIKEAVEKERYRIALLISENTIPMTQEYRSVIKHTGGLLTTSMGYAYSKGINDVVKLILKEKK